MAATRDGDPLVVLGAGCAGLSLAAALVDSGVTEEIVVIDRRTTWPDDRTWCFWDTGDVPHADLARHRWRSWAVVTDGGRAVAAAHRHPYVHVRAADLYHRLLERLARAPNVELRVGARVLAVEDGPDAVAVTTDTGVLRARLAWDAMGGAGPLLRHRPDGDVELRQAFLGQVVEASRPAFDPGMATLMDFRVGQQNGLHFVYVLPFSSTRALVEDTHIGVRPVAPGLRRAAIQAYLDRHHGAGDAEVIGEERGTLAMSSWRFPAARSARLGAVGAAAGAVRPSSGYAFVRIQRHVRAVAAAVASGGSPPSGPQGGRRAVLDRVFLKALQQDPALFPEAFRGLAARVPGDVFARFMSDASSLADDARIVAALPPGPFARAVPLAAAGGRAQGLVRTARSVPATSAPGT